MRMLHLEADPRIENQADCNNDGSRDEPEAERYSELRVEPLLVRPILRLVCAAAAHHTQLEAAGPCRGGAMYDGRWVWLDYWMAKLSSKTG